MKQITLLVVALIILLSASCKKSTESGPDYASIVAGKYGGAVPPGILSGTLVLTKQSNTRVNIDRTTPSGGKLRYESATVSDGGNGKYNVTLSSGSTTISGIYDGTVLDIYINQLQFYGVRQ
ncbi:MAG: hypothetical protein ACOYNC_15750 [Bacteroidales bacterium]